MRAFVMHKVNADMEAGRPPSKELIGRIGQLVGELASTGKFKDGAGLHGTQRRTRVSFTKGEPKVEHGPLVGAGEAIAGMTTIQVRSMDEAIDWSKRFGAVVPDGEVVVGPVVEAWDLGVAPKPEGEVPVKAIVTYKNGSGVEKDPTADEKAKLAALHAEMKKAGVFLGAYALETTKKGARLHYKGGKKSVIDGPFAESKELIAGYSLIETDNLEEVVSWSWRFAEALAEEIEMDIRIAREEA